MKDDINDILRKMTPSVLDDQFARLCCDVFLESEKGRLLMAHLFDRYIHTPFTDITTINPPIDTNQILGKAIRRDFVQTLLMYAQAYEAEASNKPKE